MRKLDARKLAREKSLFRYSSAVERADFATVEAVLREAERDPVLAQMITEINMIFESETLRLSPSLNHSSNHQQKELLMTTIILPRRQSNLQRWLPITLAAACVSVLFIGALLMRPIRPNGNSLVGLQAGSTATPTAVASPTLVPTELPTFTPTPFPASGIVEPSPLPQTVMPPANGVAYTTDCNGYKVTTEDVFVHARPSNQSTTLGRLPIGTQAQELAGGTAAEDDTSEPKTNWAFIKADVSGNSIQGWVPVSVTLPIGSCPDNTGDATVIVGQGTVPADGQSAESVPSTVVCNSKDAVITSPSSRAVVAGTINVSGVATSTNFGSYKLEIIGIGTGGNYVLLVDSSQPVASVSSLGQIDLSSYPPDNYGLRLSVFDATQQLQASCLVNFTLARVATAANTLSITNGVATVVPITVFPINAVVTTGTFTRLTPATDAAVGFTLTSGIVVKIDSQSQDGQWSHITLDGGKNGWVQTNVIQIQPVNSAQVAIAGTLNLSSGTKGIVSVQQTILHDKPDTNARMIRTLTHNTTLVVTETSADGQWTNITLPDGTQGWLLASDVQTEGVPQIAQPAMLCYGTISSQPAIVFSRPTASGGVSLGTLQPATQVIILDVENQSGNATAWYYVKSFDNNAVQGWVQDTAFINRNYCSQPSSPPDQFTVVLATTVPANGVGVATIIPANPVPVPTLIPADAQPVFTVGTEPFCGTAITVDGANIHVINQLDQAATIYAAPLTQNSNATAVGEFPAKAAASLLYQQYDHASDPISALWYLIMTGEGDKQVTGWVSANSINTSASCNPAATNVTSATAAIEPAQLQAITGVAMTASAQTGTCRVTNLNTQPVTVFAAPLTADSNAPVVGTFPVQGDAVVIFQNYDQQLSPVGALWYLVTVNGVSQPQITGWISATSINSTNACAPEQLVGVSLSPATVSAGGVNAVAVPSVDMSAPSMCQITNTTNHAVPIFVAPLTANSNALTVGEFPSGSDAIVILQNYDQQSATVGALWYLITVNNGSDKQITGWISATDLGSSGSCASETAGVSVPAQANAQMQADVATAPVIGDSGPAINCLVNTSNNESVPVFSGPNESLVVNNLPPNMPATVLYQQLDPTTNLSWYLILAVSKEGKQVSGWVSSDSVSIDTTHCTQKP